MFKQFKIMSPRPWNHPARSILQSVTFVVCVYCRVRFYTVRCLFIIVNKTDYISLRTYPTHHKSNKYISNIDFFYWQNSESNIFNQFMTKEYAFIGNYDSGSNLVKNKNLDLKNLSMCDRFR